MLKMMQENLRGGLSFQSKRFFQYFSINILFNNYVFCSFFISYLYLIVRYEESSAFKRNEEGFNLSHEGKPSQHILYIDGE